MSVPAERTTKYASVLFQKQRGTLVLDSVRIFFETLDSSSSSASTVSVSWSDLVKHQVSPATHAKPLLRLLLTARKDESDSSLTFQLESRDALEQIRVDISDRLKGLRAAATAASSVPHTHTRKRPFADYEPITTNPSSHEHGQYLHSLTRLNPVMATVARSSLLASDVTLQTQHSLLVLSSHSSAAAANASHTPPLLTSPPPPPSQSTLNHNHTSVISESDFWNTHVQPLSYHAAEIYGIADPGRSSMIRSSLDIFSTSHTSTTGGKATTVGADSQKSTLKSSNRFVSLGVEEIREIFLMYPAVHKAYEEKVPLELSEEQFWKKYLESEFFHRDRGRLGSHFLLGVTSSSFTSSKKSDTRKEDVSAAEETSKALSEAQQRHQEENARVAIASTGDMFSRVDLGLSKPNIQQSLGTTPLAIGQFDLASTLYTERGGKLLLLQHHGMEGVVSTSNASYTASSSSSNATTSKESRIVDKYNRHWAFVLNPNDAKVGTSNLELARHSIKHFAQDDDDDAQPGGGVNNEMQRLVRFANAKEGRVDHVRCVGEEEPSEAAGLNSDLNHPTQVLYKDLTLKNIEMYSGQDMTLDNPSRAITTTETSGEVQARSSLPRHLVFSKLMVGRMKSMVTSLTTTDARECMNQALPEASFGREILKHLTKRMVADSISEEDALKMTHQLPEEFKQQLASYFRRCSELLRHFFALRRVIEMEKMNPTMEGSDRSMITKSKKIIKAMEEVYREMESVRNTLPLTETGEIMRKMYLSIMNQLDWAFKLNRDSSTSGGFVSVED